MAVIEVHPGHPDCDKWVPLMLTAEEAGLVLVGLTTLAESGRTVPDQLTARASRTFDLALAKLTAPAKKKRR